MDGVSLFQITVDNMERAIKFFIETFGWDLMATGMEGNSHFATTVPTDDNGYPTEPGGINGVLIERGTYSQKYIGIFIKVKSIAATLENVVRNGGKTIREKAPIGDFAYFAQINDTEGNLIALWEDKI